MSVGSRTVEAVIGSAVVLTATWYILNHKEQFSSWWNNLVSSVTGQASSSPSLPTTKPSTPPHPTPTQTPTAIHPSATTPHNAPSPWYNTNPYNKNPNYPPGPNLHPSTPPPPKTADQSKPHSHPMIPAHQGMIPNVNNPEVNPYVTPPPMLTPHPSHTPVPSNPSAPAKHAVYIPVENTVHPSAPVVKTPTQVQKTPPIHHQPPIPTSPTARKNPNIKSPRNGAICGDLNTAVCGSTCIVKGGTAKMYVACNPGAPKAYQRVGVERGWFPGWSGDTPSHSGSLRKHAQQWDITPTINNALPSTLGSEYEYPGSDVGHHAMQHANQPVWEHSGGQSV